MDFADQLLFAKNRSERRFSRDNVPTEGVDEFGIPIPYPVTEDYFVARILLRNKGIYYDEITESKPVIRKANGEAVPINNDSILVLTGVSPSRYGFPRTEWVFIWEKLKEKLPRYDTTCFSIGDGMRWSFEKGILEEYDKETESWVPLWQ